MAINEIVSYELAKLIYDYAKEKKEIDFNFINRVIEVYVCHYGIQNYARSIIIDNDHYDEENMECAAYIASSKAIKVNIPTLYLSVGVCADAIPLSYLETMFFKYIKVVQVLLHELTHAYQEKITDTNAYDTETRVLQIVNKGKAISNKTIMEKLLRAGFTKDQVAIYIREMNKKYKQFYEIAPHEKHAESYSLLGSLEITKLLGQEIPVIEAYQKWDIYSNLLRGYDSFEIPTREYFKQIRAEDKWSEVDALSDREDLSSFNRMTLGLRVDSETISQIEDKRSEVRDLLR